MWWWIDNETASDSDSEKELPDNIIDQRNLYDLRLKEIRHYIDNYCDRSELFWISEYPYIDEIVLYNCTQTNIHLKKDIYDEMYYVCDREEILSLEDIPDDEDIVFYPSKLQKLFELSLDILEICGINTCEEQIVATAYEIIRHRNKWWYCEPYIRVRAPKCPSKKILYR
tara:strand:- start:300 stop:809 length:510 start_codon:yes stop_codon:yes gene_type:complete